MSVVWASGERDRVIKIQGCKWSCFFSFCIYLQDFFYIYILSTYQYISPLWLYNWISRCYLLSKHLGRDFFTIFIFLIYRISSIHLLLYVTFHIPSYKSNFFEAPNPSFVYLCSYFCPFQVEMAPPLSHINVSYLPHTWVRL